MRRLDAQPVAAAGALILRCLLSVGCGADATEPPAMNPPAETAPPDETKAPAEPAPPAVAADFSSCTVSGAWSAPLEDFTAGPETGAAGIAFDGVRDLYVVGYMKDQIPSYHWLVRRSSDGG